MFVPPDLAWLLLGLDSPVSLAPFAYWEGCEQDEPRPGQAEGEEDPNEADDSASEK